MRVHCSRTARLLHEAEMFPGRRHASLYVQSLRGDPHHESRFGVLVNYRDQAYPLEIVAVDTAVEHDGDGGIQPPN